MFLLHDTDVKPCIALQSSWFAEIPNSEHIHLAKLQPNEFPASFTIYYVTNQNWEATAASCS